MDGFFLVAPRVLSVYAVSGVLTDCLEPTHKIFVQVLEFLKAAFFLKLPLCETRVR